MRNPLVVFLAVDNVSDDPAMSDAAYRGVLSRIAPLLEEWAQSFGGVLREVGRDRYLCLLEESNLDEICNARFDILDKVRALSAGVKCSDAEQFGVPVRVVVSPKGLKNGTIEIASRDKSMKEIKPVDEAVDFVYNYVVDALAALECRL